MILWWNINVVATMVGGVVSVTLLLTFCDAVLFGAFMFGLDMTYMVDIMVIVILMVVVVFLVFDFG